MTGANTLYDRADDPAYSSLRLQYENLVGRNLAGVYRTTLSDGRFLECNDAMASMLGYKDRDELIKAGARVLYFSDTDRTRFMDRLKREKRLVNFELTLRHKDGRAVEVMENVFLDEHQDGEATVQGTVVDVTDHRRAEHELQQLANSYRSLLEHVRDGILVVIGDHVRYGNPAALRSIGVDTLEGMDLSSIVLVKDLPLLRSCIRRCLRGEANDPVQVRLRDGRSLEFFPVSTPYEGMPAVQLTLQDRTGEEEQGRMGLRMRMAEEVNAVLRSEIAEHRRTQEALSNAERFSRSLIDSSLDMIMAADPSGRITVYNPAACKRFGWEPAEIMGLHVSLLYADVGEYRRIQGELDAQGTFVGEVMNRTRQGEVFVSHLTAARLLDEKGASVGAMGVSRDITRLKQDQEALRISEERYRDLFENSTDLIQSVNVHGGFEYVNAAWRAALGYSESQVGALTIWDMIRADQQEQCKALFQQVFDGQGPVLVRTVLLARDGREVMVEGNTTLRMVGGLPVATRSTFRDVTKERQAERLLLQHEAKWKALFESSDHMFWTVDPGIRLTSFNRGYAEMIERLHGERPELNTDPGKPRRRFATEAYHSFWEERYAQAFAGRAIRFETELVDRKGQRVCNEILLSPVFDDQRAVKEVFGIGHEITDQKIAEDRVREQSARLQAIFESSANMMIWTLDRELDITSGNEHFMKSMETDFGVRYTVGSPIISQPPGHPPDPNSQQLVKKFRSVLEGRSQHYELPFTDVKGNIVWIEGFLNPIFVEGTVQEISCLAHDVTERRQAQAELIQSLQEKEVLLKEVHHRVKNNLQIVSSIFNLQAAFVGDDERLLGLLRDSRDRIRSMSFIHESLYQARDFSSIELAGYMDSLARNLLLSYSLSGKVRLESDLKPVHLVLDQAIPCGLILNELISNALKHAFPNDREGVIRLGIEEREGEVRISISDNGIGLPPAFDLMRDRSLGLELVYTLSDQLDGNIHTTNEGGLAYLITFDRVK